MSFEKKLYDIEVTPPQNVWENICMALDDTALEDSFKKKLAGLSSEPPAAIWSAIIETLDEQVSTKNISEKLNDLSEIPPANIWNKIETELEEDIITEKIAKHLTALEVIPPEKNWTYILSELDKTARVIPFIKKYNRLIKYASAAIVIGLIAWGGISLMNTGSNKKTGNEIAKGDTLTPAIKTSSQNTEVKTSTPVTSTTVIKELTLKKKRNNSTTREPGNNIYAAVNSFQENHSGAEEIIADGNNAQQNKRIPIANNNADTAAPRYLVYLNEEGSLMKVSKKLADLQCIYTKDGEVTQDFLASLNKQICTDLVKTWQEKLAKAPFSSFDPLEMADILK